MWKKLRFRFNLKINRTLGKMSDNKSLSIQEEEILMELRGDSRPILKN